MDSAVQQLTDEEIMASPWLHIYAQYAWHEEASIEGTRSALQSLRDAIDTALQTGMDSEAQAFAADGEGYGVTVKIRSLEFLTQARLPYTMKFARGRDTKRKGTG